MPPQRTHVAGLIRLLNAAEQPIYVLDDELTIVFLNQAAQEWLGTGESILGRRCTYHSNPTADKLDAAAANLCPPPQSLSAQNTVASVSRIAENGQISERRANFITFGGTTDNPLAVIAVLDAEDLPPTSADRSSDTFDASCKIPAEIAEAGSIALHEIVRRFHQEAAARYRIDRLIGHGPAMRLARRQVELAIGSHGSVLLVGPAGSGRRHFAATIHYAATENKSQAETPAHSDRSEGSPAAHAAQEEFAFRFAALDCPLLGVDLPDAIREATTPTNRRNDQTIQGTLVLHRIDEISAEIQVVVAGLLLQRPATLRFIATGAEPLIELARRGKFRADLAAALSTIVIELPPLAQRRDDLPLLAQLFLENQNAAGRRQIGGFTQAALDMLDSYPWPGNLDELAQTIAEGHQKAAGREIDVSDLPDRLRLAGQAAAHPRRTDETIVLDEYLGRVERELIRRALARAKGNKARAARLLGLTRPRLYRRMIQLGLE